MATKTTIEMAREAAGDDWGLFQEYMPEIHRLAELVRADERARMAEQPTTTENNGGKTGWPPGLLQDDCKGLSKWLSNRPDAKRRVREALAEQPAQQQTMYLESGGLGYGPAPERKLIIGYVNKPEQPAPVQQEPVAWMHEWEDGEKIPMLQGRDDRNQDAPKTVRPLVYGDTPPQPAQQEPVPVELVGVEEAIKNGNGFWKSCTGCYETNEGHPPTGAFFSLVFKCHMGHGCSECGGIGAIWDDTDYEAMADYMMLDDAAPQPAQQELVATTQEVIGCFDAAFAEGLQEALAETTDERLKDLVERRLMHALYAAQNTAPPSQRKPLELDEYDAGFLNDFGGGNVEWWWDYIRYELGRAHDFYQEQVEAAHGIKENT